MSDCVLALELLLGASMTLITWFTTKIVTFGSAALELTVTSVACVALIAVLEIWQLGYRNSSIRAITSGDASARRDLLSFVLDVTGILRILGHLVTLGIGFAIGNVVRVYLNINVTDLVANPILQVSLFLFLKSFSDYWMHRWMHLSPVLWEIHKYHHSAADMNIVTAHRESILVTPFVSIFVALPLGIIGTPVQTFVVLAVLMEFHALLIHSRLPLSFGWFDRLLISPRAHRLHHALGLSKGTQNFGFTTSIWDHVFGTYASAPEEHFTVGLEGDIYNHVSWPREMLHSMVAIKRAAWRSMGWHSDAEPAATMPGQTDTPRSLAAPQQP